MNSEYCKVLIVYITMYIHNIDDDHDKEIAILSSFYKADYKNQVFTMKQY